VSYVYPEMVSNDSNYTWSHESWPPAINMPPVEANTH